MTLRYKISQIGTISGVFIWVGMVCGISFLESWLKFQSPGMTIDIGVGIGRLVFDILNKVEIFLAIIILFFWWQIKQGKPKDASYIAFGIALVVLAVQTLVLLPIMDTRADLRLQGAVLPPSYMHIYYVGGEIIKVSGLTIFGIKNIK